VLREHRGDGHVTVLRDEGLEPCDALVLHAATGVPEPVHLRENRGWTTDDWSAATQRLQCRGWLTGPGTITDVGRDTRARIETRTDELAAVPVNADAERLAELLDPIVERVIA